MSAGTSGVLYLGPALPGGEMQGTAYYYHFGNIKYVHFIHRVFLLLIVNTAPHSTWTWIFNHFPEFYWMFQKENLKSWQDIFLFSDCNRLGECYSNKVNAITEAVTAVNVPGFVNFKTEAISTDLYCICTALEFLSGIFRLLLEFLSGISSYISRI